MKIDDVLRDLNKGLLADNAMLDKENTILKEENTRLKKLVERMRNRLIEIDCDIKHGNKMGRYVDGIRQGIFKPRRNNDIDERAILRTILKLNTRDMNIIAEALNSSYPTIRRRLIESGLYPIDLNDIRDTYNLFYSSDNK